MTRSGKLDGLPLVHICGALLVAVAWGPIAAIFLRSFSTNVYSLRLGTLGAYRNLHSADAGILALKNSLLVAGSVAIISCISAFLVITVILLSIRAWNPVFMSVLLLPLLIPDLIGGIAWNALFASLGVRLSLATVVVAQSSYGHIYALLIYIFGASKIDPEQPQIGLALAGSKWKVFSQLLVPLLAPYALSSFLLVFVLSLDDFVTAFFTSGPGAETLTVHLYTIFRRGFSTKLFALAAILAVLSSLLAVASELISKGVMVMLRTSKNRESKALFLLFVVAVLSILSLAGCRRDSEVATLHVYNWNDYMVPEVLSEFEREYSIKVVHDVYSSNDELYAKVKNKNSGYDVVVPSDYMVAIMVREGLLAEINASSLRNFSNILPGFRNLAFDPGNKYSVPYFFGSTGVAFDGTNAELRRAVESKGFGVFFDKSLGEIRYTVVDDMRYGLGLPLKYLNLDVNTEDREDIYAAANLLKSVRPRILAFSGDSYIELLARGEVSLAYGYSGDVASAAKENPRLVYYVPKSGTILGVDNLAVLAESKNREAALKFIDFILRPKVHAKIANGINWGCPNGPARTYVKPELLNNHGIYLPDEVVSRSSAIRDVGPEIEKIYAAAWRSVVEQ